MFILILLLALLYNTPFAQNAFETDTPDIEEAYIRFHKNDNEFLQQALRYISIDKVTADSVYAYINSKGYSFLRNRHIHFEILPHPGDVPASMGATKESITAWDVYPTYDGYLQMMNQFATDFPSLCRIVEAGQSVQGRKILFAVLSADVMNTRAEPKCLYTSSMHGDELTGYVLMLRLIDSLLHSYGTDARLTRLLDSAEIWINPLANPDGTYRSGNNTVSGARRFNANNIDLNRNFPDPADGPHPDGNDWQPENLAMMSIAAANYFNISANFHGGTEVVNYPWDTWVRRHPDDAWWQYISHRYADTAQAYSPVGYMSGFNDGITNGYDWYRVAGGRQDYMTYFKHGRELTIEISNTKLVPAATLPNYWEYNKRSLLNYLENVFTGIQGVLTTGLSLPLTLSTKISIPGFDQDNSFVYNDSTTGYYLKMIAPGTYTIKYEWTSYPFIGAMVFNNIPVIQNQKTIVSFIIPIPLSPVELLSFSAIKNGKRVILEWTTASETNNNGFEIEWRQMTNSWQTIGYISGKGNSTETQIYQYIDTRSIPGISEYRLRQIDFNGTSMYSQVVRVVAETVSAFSVPVVYPNPFNASAFLHFSILEQSSAELKVYTALGELIEQTHLGILQAGTHSHRLPGKLSAGIYLFSLQLSSEYYTGKFIVLP